MADTVLMELKIMQSNDTVLTTMYIIIASYYRTVATITTTTAIA